MAEYRDKGAKQLYEETAYIIDYLPYGKPGARTKFRSGAVVQMVGENYFTLLEAIVKEGLVVKLFDRVYVGKEERREIEYIIGRISYSELTANAKMELEVAVEKIVNAKEKLFISFFNNAQPITPRMHALELIPGIGKKYMWKILDMRDKKPYESFEDLQNRANVPSPAKAITKRIVEELSGESKYQLFTRPS